MIFAKKEAADKRFKVKKEIETANYDMGFVFPKREWIQEDQLMISAAYLAMVSTVAPIVLRNASKDKKATFLFKIGED